MKKILKSKRFIFLLVLVNIFICLSFQNNNVLAFNNKEEKNSINIIIDNFNYDRIPNNFRSTNNLSLLKNTSSLNLNKFDELNISGSQQFSSTNINIIKDNLNTTLPITIIDLREESHGFINNFPISFENKLNNANKNLTKRQVILTEKNLLKDIKLDVPIIFFNKNKTKIIPKEVQTEKKLSKSNSLSYIRVPVTDRELPNSDTVDYFVDVVKECSKNTWFHYHCKEGVGRTTTFMIMHDMMKNCDVATADEIIQRQLSIANFNQDRIKYLSSPKRIEFLNTFYKYCLETKDNLNIKWSDWIHY